MFNLILFIRKCAPVALTHSSEAAHVIELFCTLYCVCQIFTIGMMSWSAPAVLYVVYSMCQSCDVDRGHRPPALLPLMLSLLMLAQLQWCTRMCQVGYIMSFMIFFLSTGTLQTKKGVTENLMLSL